MYLLKTPHKHLKTTSNGFVSSLKSDHNPFSKLYVASQFRDGNLNEGFSHEIQSCPQNQREQDSAVRISEQRNEM